MSPMRHAGWVGLMMLLACAATGEAQTFRFYQLDKQGIATSTLNSSWGRLEMDFTGFSSTQYFNLNVNGNWVVQNMGVDSLFGTGVSQTVATLFDFSVAPGTDVANINWGFSLGATPGADPGTSLMSLVNNLSWQIGGEDNVDLGGAAAHAPQNGANAATLTMSAKLPNISQMPNQPQGANECAPGAVSNSLKYLQNTGQLPMSMATDISDLKTVLGTTATGTPANWYQTKKDHYAGTLDTQFLQPTDIMDLINAINAGKDVEVDLKGHVAVVAGVRKYSDGRVELDIFDDNQTDNMSDPMRTVQIVSGNIDGMELERFVVEMAIPEPATLPLMTLAAAALLRTRRRAA